MKSKKIERDKQSNKQCKEGRQQRNAQEVREKKRATKSFFMFDFNEKLCFCCYATSFLYVYMCDVKVIAPFVVSRGLNLWEKETSAMQ